MLLQPTQERGEAGRASFHERMRQFQQGDWNALLTTPSKKAHMKHQEVPPEVAEQRQLRMAEAKIRLKEITRARTQLMSSGLVPGNQQTLDELREPRAPPQCGKRSNT